MICEHGSLKRSCQICDLQEEVNELKKEKENLEDIISAVANIDTAFMDGEGDCNYTDKEALDKIMELVNPIWNEIATRKRTEYEEEFKEMLNFTNKSNNEK